MNMNESENNNSCRRRRCYYDDSEYISTTTNSSSSSSSDGSSGSGETVTIISYKVETVKLYSPTTTTATTTSRLVFQFDSSLKLPLWYPLWFAVLLIQPIVTLG